LRDAGSNLPELARYSHTGSSLQLSSTGSSFWTFFFFFGAGFFSSSSALMSGLGLSGED
jgi:hypothetical protein